MLASLSIPELRRGSIAVIRATVVTARARAAAALPRHAGAEAIGCWDNLVQIADIISGGDLVEAGSLIVIRTFRTDSEAVFSSGEDALVFLGSIDEEVFEYHFARTDSRLSALPAFRVFGGYQGKFTIETTANPVYSQPGHPRTGLDVLRRALSWYEESAIEAERYRANTAGS